MRVHYASLAALLFAACSSSGPSEELPVFSLAETDLPGVFEVTAVGMDEAAGFTFTCDDQVTGTPTLIDGLWLAARDRVEVEARCGLQGVTLAGGTLDRAADAAPGHARGLKRSFSTRSATRGLILGSSVRSAARSASRCP